MKNFNLTHTAIVIIVFFSALLLFRLNSGEVQPWDEGLYAVRAKSILKYSEIIDQSKHSVGGLYSATYPPVLVWAQAGAMKLFGEGLFAIRIFPVVCSIFSLVFIYLISNRIFSKDFSIIIVIGTACTLSWNTFSRRNQ